MIYKELRKQRGETIKQTAEAIGISASHLGRIESGKRTLTEEIEAKLQRYFNIDFKKGDKLVLVDKSKLSNIHNSIYPHFFTENKDDVFTVWTIPQSCKSLYVKRLDEEIGTIIPEEIGAFKKLDEKDNEIKVVHEPIIEIQNQVAQQSEQAEETHTQRCTRYRKPIPKDWDYIDVYRVCELFNVDDSSGATQQAMKKLIAAGSRGYKDKLQDYKEAQFAIDEKIKLLEGAKDV